jgi:hypothetical protein
MICFSYVVKYPIKSNHRPIVLLESGIFFHPFRYSCPQLPDRFTAFSNFWFQNVNIGDSWAEKNQQFEIFIFTKVMAIKVKIFAHFLEKMPWWKKFVPKAQNKNQILKLHKILRRNSPIQFFRKTLFSWLKKFPKSANGHEK